MSQTVVDRIEQAVDLLAEHCRTLDVDTIDPGEIARLHACLVRAERLGAGARVRLARRVIDAPEATGGACGPAGWIAQQTGTTLTEARRHLAVSEDLPHRPHLDTALETGIISTSQLHAISGGITAAPDAEAELVDLATSHTTDLTDLRRRSRDLAAAADPDPDATRARHHARRAFRTWHADDGEWHARLNAPADTGAHIMAAIKAATDHAFTTAHQAGRHEAADTYALDGLVATLDQPTTEEAGSKRNRSRGRERKVIGIVDITALQRGTLTPEDRCELAGVGPVSLSAMRTLLDDATVALLIRRGTVDLAVAHLGRQPTAFQRTALQARGYRCAVTGCGATRHLEIDHTKEWATTHQTRLVDLDWLCPHHHLAKTRGHIRLTGPPGNRTAIPVQQLTLTTKPP